MVRAVAIASLGILAVSGCASRTKVELDSASAPVVEPVDGAGDNGVDVVDAGVIEIDDGSPTATTEPAPAASTTAAPTE
ncbi:MAG: hypothetical protein HZB15_12545, partial [Actinobacteria bacterium]|nr:hypothetical protein [Actinomycetota bacterium]